MNEITVSHAKSLYQGSFIDDDLLLIDDLARLPLPNEPRRMRCLFMALCTNGKAEYSVDTEQHLVKKNDIIIISEGQVTDNYMLSPDCTGIAIMVSYDFFREIISGVHEVSSLFLFSRSHPVFSLNAEEAQMISNYFRLIRKKVDNQEHHFRRDIVRMFIAMMIYDISNTMYHIQYLSEKKQTRAEKIFTDFIRLVEQYFRHERRVGWYAQRLCITPKYLSESVKQVSHRTPNEWIDNYVTLEIRVQLRNSTRSVKEISEYLHFPNQSFLGKYFKEHVGMSPTEYRKS